MDSSNRKESQECRGQMDTSGRGVGPHSRGTPEALSFALSNDGEADQAGGIHCDNSGRFASPPQQDEPPCKHNFVEDYFGDPEVPGGQYFFTWCDKCGATPDGQNVFGNGFFRGEG